MFVGTPCARPQISAKLPSGRMPSAVVVLLGNSRWQIVLLHLQPPLTDTLPLMTWVRMGMLALLVGPALSMGNDREPAYR